MRTYAGGLALGGRRLQHITSAVDTTFQVIILSAQTIPRDTISMGSMCFVVLFNYILAELR